MTAHVVEIEMDEWDAYSASGKAAHELCVWVFCQGYLCFEDMIVDISRRTLETLTHVAGLHVLAGWKFAP